jgi:AcrR family transcriptional regulator
MTSASQKSSLGLANPSRITPDVASDSSEKRGRILDAALSHFLRYGVKRTSVDDVAREAGIAKGTVYLYFDSKTALFSAIAERLCADTLAEARGIVGEAKPLTERIVKFLDCHVGKPHRLVAQSPHVAELAASKQAIAKASYDALDRRMKALLRGLLAEAGIVEARATEMFLAAARGTLRTGDAAAKPYRTRLTAMTDVLIAGLTSEVER